MENRYLRCPTGTGSWWSITWMPRPSGADWGSYRHQEGWFRRHRGQLWTLFWSRQHWLRSATLYLPGQEGGQGPGDIASRVTAFRLQTAQRLQDGFQPTMEPTGPPGYDKHLFLLQPQCFELTCLTPFYQSVLQAWRTRVVKHKPRMWIFEKLLKGNSFISSQLLSEKQRLQTV